MRDIHTIFLLKTQKNSAWNQSTMQLTEMLPLVVTSIVSNPSRKDLSSDWLIILSSVYHMKETGWEHICFSDVRDLHWKYEAAKAAKVQSSWSLRRSWRTLLEFFIFILSSFTCNDTRNNKGNCLSILSYFRTNCPDLIQPTSVMFSSTGWSLLGKSFSDPIGPTFGE